ncbi:MAG: hypothetical protein AAB036_09895 [Elusimicrobiota bacterium]
MIDLFGLKNRDKESDQQARQADAQPAPPRGSHKLWAFLLVLDAVFVIVFAGAVAAKIYQYRNAPPAVVVAPRRRPVKEPAKAPDAPAVAAAPTPAPVTATPAAPAAKAPEPPSAPVKASADAPKPPKPTMLTDAPRHRDTPRPADHAAKAAPTPPASGEVKVKAVGVDFKLHAPKARSVSVVGAFIMRGGRQEMTRQEDGTWTATIYLKPGQYRYTFAVDKKKQLDPENPHSERGASLISVP